MEIKINDTHLTITLVVLLILLLLSVVVMTFAMTGTLNAISVNQEEIRLHTGEMIRCEYMKECNETALQKEIDSLYEEREKEEAIWWPRLGYSSLSVASIIMLIILVKIPKSKGGKEDG